MHYFYQDSTRKRRKRKRKKKKETHKIDVTPWSDRDKNPFSNLIAALLTRLADFSSRLIYHLKVFTCVLWLCFALLYTLLVDLQSTPLFANQTHSIIQIRKSSKLSNTFDVHGNIFSFFFLFVFFFML